MLCVLACVRAACARARVFGARCAGAWRHCWCARARAARADVTSILSDRRRDDGALRARVFVKTTTRACCWPHPSYLVPAPSHTCLPAIPTTCLPFFPSSTTYHHHHHPSSLSFISRVPNTLSCLLLGDNGDFCHLEVTVGGEACSGDASRLAVDGGHGLYYGS